MGVVCYQNQNGLDFLDIKQLSRKPHQRSREGYKDFLKILSTFLISYISLKLASAALSKLK